MARQKKQNVPVWQRGYRCHTLWLANKCIGRVELGEYGAGTELYQCQAGTIRGETRTLSQAKQWVLSAAMEARVQQQLF